jgi:hypothetical protein
MSPKSSVRRPLLMSNVRQHMETRIMYIDCKSADLVGPIQT